MLKIRIHDDDGLPFRGLDALTMSWNQRLPTFMKERSNARVARRGIQE